jgi:uncharacterized membrane protein YidH (DUF202 family)
VDLTMTATTSGIVEHETLPVSSGRLWTGVLLAPSAWAVAHLLGYFLASRACDRGTARMAANAGVTQDILAVVLALVAVAGLVVAIGNWRRVSEPSRPHDSVARGRAHFMALGGVVTSALFTLGIVFFALPPLLINICSEVR